MSGELPEGWTQAPLSTLLAEGPTNGYSPANVPDAAGTLTLRLGATTTGRLVLNDQTTKRLGEVIPPQSNLWLVPGDILVQRANTLSYVGTAALYDGPPATYVYPDLMMRLRPIDRLVDARYLYRFLNSDEARGYMRERATGTAGNMPKINGATVRSVPVLLPPLPEQRRIVAKLEDLLARSRRAKTTLDAVPPLLEKLRQSVLAAAFRGDLTADWRAKHPDVEPAEALLARIRVERRRKWEEAELAKMAAKGKVPGDDRWKAKYVEPGAVDAEGLPGLPAGWCWASVEQLGLIESGQTTEGLAEHSAGSRQDVPWFRVSDMNVPGNDPVMQTSQVWLSNEEVRGFGLHVRPRGTIIFPKRGGAIATNKKRLLGQPSAYDLNTMGVVPIDSLAGYIWSWFQLLDLGSLNTGTSVPQINHGDIAPLIVPIPPLAEAARIAASVESAGTVMRAMAARLTAAETSRSHLDRATLAKAFRGTLVD